MGSLRLPNEDINTAFAIHARPAEDSEPYLEFAQRRLEVGNLVLLWSLGFGAWDLPAHLSEFAFRRQKPFHNLRTTHRSQTEFLPSPSTRF